MSCEQLRLLRQVAVEQAEALEGAAWREHLNECGECREEWTAYAQSLAVYRQLEAERLSRVPPVPSWEQVSHTIRENASWWGFSGRLRLPAAAAVVGIVSVAGAFSWNTWNSAPERPSQTVESRGDESRTVESRTVENESQPRQAAPSERWYVTPEQLSGVARREVRRSRSLRLGTGRQSTVTFELRAEPGAAVSVEFSPKKGKRTVILTEGETRQTVVSGPSREQGWRPPTATMRAENSPLGQTPTSYRPSR